MNEANRPHYAMAPYNFIDFPEQWIARYDSLDELPKHNELNEKLFSGSLEFEWEAVTPVIVAEEDKENKGVKRFFRNQDGYAIPGNTIRGMIRSHVMILGLANYRDDIQNARFMYRDMASINKSLKEQYAASIGLLGHAKQARQQEFRGLLPDKLKTGIVEKRGDDYYVRPSKTLDNGKQFFRLSEHKLRNMRLSDSRIRYMYRPEVWQSYQPGQRIERVYENPDYEPYYLRVSFTLDNRNNVHRIFAGDASKPAGTMDGWLLSSGFIGNKKSHYVILDEDAEAPAKRIPDELVRHYRNDLNRKKYGGNRHLNRKYQYYHLPERPGEKKPIFFVEDPGTGEIAYFGFTPICASSTIIPCMTAFRKPSGKAANWIMR